LDRSAATIARQIGGGGRHANLIVTMRLVDRLTAMGGRQQICLVATSSDQNNGCHAYLLASTFLYYFLYIKGQPLQNT
jgi:hypothetical protein